LKPLTVLSLLVLCAGCAEFPELEGRESASVQRAPYPPLIPLDSALGAPVDPVSEAEEIEQDLARRADALSRRAKALQNASTD